MPERALPATSRAATLECHHTRRTRVGRACRGTGVTAGRCAAPEWTPPWRPWQVDGARWRQSAGPADRPRRAVGRRGDARRRPCRGLSTRAYVTGVTSTAVYWPSSTISRPPRPLHCAHTRRRAPPSPLPPPHCFCPAPPPPSPLSTLGCWLGTSGAAQSARMRAFALSSPEQARPRATDPRVAAGHRRSSVHVHTSHGSTPGESLVTSELCPVPLRPPFTGTAPVNPAAEPKGSIAWSHLVPGGFVHIDSLTPI
jgi:hypothetical protein